MLIESVASEVFRFSHGFQRRIQIPKNKMKPDPFPAMRPVQALKFWQMRPIASRIHPKKAHSEIIPGRWGNP
jgi:hypothetical protein